MKPVPIVGQVFTDPKTGWLFRESRSTRTVKAGDIVLASGRTARFPELPVKKRTFRSPIVGFAIEDAKKGEILALLVQGGTRGAKAAYRRALKARPKASEDPLPIRPVP